MRGPLLTAIVLCAPLLGGCQCGSPPRAPAEGPSDGSPVIGQVAIPSFPPIGPQTTLSATITDSDGLLSAYVDFAEHKSFGVSDEDQVTVTFTGKDIGEGFGRAVITACDVFRQCEQAALEGIAVDLSPPDAQLLDTVVRRGEGSSVWIWVGDAFVLGNVTVSFQGGSQSYAFEAGYPATFGDAWDESLLDFPSSAFPEGQGSFHIRAEDASGNVLEKDFDLLLDGTPPGVSVQSPSPSDVVSGIVHVEASAEDDTGGPVWVALSLGGTPIGTFAGPTAKVDIDTTDFAPGELALSVTALDQAGNESAPVLVPLVLQ